MREVGEKKDRRTDYFIYSSVKLFVLLVLFYYSLLFFTNLRKYNLKRTMDLYILGNYIEIYTLNVI